jgi:hypothetical protein
MYIVMMMEGISVHPCWVGVVWRTSHFSSFLVGAVGGNFSGFHMTCGT